MNEMKIAAPEEEEEPELKPVVHDAPAEEEKDDGF